MLASTIHLSLPLVCLILATAAFIVGCVVHAPQRTRDPLFWGLVGLALWSFAEWVLKVF